MMTAADTELEFHNVIIVGAGPGGISVAAALHDKNIADVLIVDKGEIGESWSEYPPDTHVLTESRPDNDKNMIAGVPTSAVFPNILNPNHMLYQKYLAYVVEQKKIAVQTHVMIDHVMYDRQTQLFLLESQDEPKYTCRFLVWAGGLYSSPNENLDAEGCFIHYAKFPYMDEIASNDITVVGSANGANGVIMELARPGRLITLVSPHEYTLEEPVDTLWKEQTQFVLDLEKQGLVKIIPNFRVSRIYNEEGAYILENEKGEKLTALKRPIICIGFLPNIAPIQEYIEEVCEHHETFLLVDEHHQSHKQPGLYIAGAIGKIKPDEGMIAGFREFGPKIAEDIANRSHLSESISLV